MKLLIPPKRDSKINFNVRSDFRKSVDSRTFQHHFVIILERCVFIYRLLINSELEMSLKIKIKYFSKICEGAEKFLAWPIDQVSEFIFDFLLGMKWEKNVSLIKSLFKVSFPFFTSCS